MPTATFYTYTGDPRVANKAMSSVKVTGTIHPLEPLSDIDAKLIVDYDATIMPCNYFEYDGVYYQITNKERLTAQGLAVYGTIDGLLTYWTGISGCTCIFRRNSNAAAPDFQDSEYVVECGYLQDTIDGTGIGDDSLIILGYVK